MSKSFAFVALCLLPTAYCLLSSILSAQNANQSPSSLTATAQTSPSPSPTPTPPLTLHQWGAVTLFHGLPSDRVRAVAQSQDGAMWFGTDSGLAKYDGRRTQTLAVEGLMSKRVLALKSDADGSLWVGAETGAMRIVNNDAHAIPETAGRSISSIVTPERGHAILASEDGMIFDCRVSASGSLAVKTIPEKPLKSEDFERPGPLNLTSLALKDNVLYVGTLTRGVIAIEDNKVSEIKSTPRPFFVNTVALDSQGHLWYGAKAKKDESGLYKANDLMRPAKLGAGLGAVAVITEGLHDDMWIGTDGRGVFHYDNAAHLIERFTFDGTAGGLRSDHVYSIFIDREEVVWFGTDRGVCRYDSHAPKVENVSTHPESNFVRTLFQTSNGKLLAGTNRGLFVYEKNAWTPVQELSQTPIYAVTEDRSGRVLVGSAIGLYRSEKQASAGAGALHFKQIESQSADASAGDQIRAIAELQGKTYIAVLGRGVERVDEAGRTLVWPNAQMDAQAREVISLHADKSGRLLIGTSSEGVLFFDGKSTTSLPALEKLKGAAVRAMLDEGNDRLWIASTRGLYLYHAGELREIITNLDARDLVVTTDQSSASVWCATSSGILKVLMDDQLGAVISRLDVDQGLPSQNTFAVLPLHASDNNETLWIGTNRGVARYTPSNVAPVLTPVRVIGQRIHQLSELSTGVYLDYPQNSLVLDVTATSSRTFPEQFQYAFLLYDSGGRIIKQKLSHDAQFTMENLKAGRYKVTARAFSKDLIPSEPLTFEFSVAGAPFPKTTVALSVLLALALIALWWGYHQNQRLKRTGATLKETNRQLADARVQLANETEAERRRIARDLHDQTLADLRHLLMLTDQLPTNGNDSTHDKTPAPVVFRSEIESISHEIRRICEDLSPSVLENVGFLAALEWALSNAVTHSPPARRFEYEFVADDNLEERLNFQRATQMQIYRIVQEVVSNISRHSGATRVRLSVKTCADGAFLLSIEDNGRDFEPQDGKRKQGRGLANIHARASLIEAEVNWKKRVGGGTEFTLRKENAVNAQSLEAES